MTKQTITVNDTPVEVATKPLTVLCHRGDANVSVPDAVEINPEMTLSRARAISEDDWKAITSSQSFFYLYKLIWGDSPAPEYGKANLAQLHTIGLMVLLAEAKIDGKPVFLKQPETYLHPAQQLGLADLLISFGGGSK